MAKVGLYKGFSFFEYQRNKTFRVIDIDAVKLDLLSHIYTKRGSRVMMPSFGTIIPELVFEPLDQETLDVLEEELTRVFNYDPRVQLLNLSVTPDTDNYIVMVSATLMYVELEMVDNFELNIQFEN